MNMNRPDISRELLAWYDCNARGLPWRASQDPYRVWVSEVMLQQTRVDSVIPYYLNWLKAFPDIQHLAAVVGGFGLLQPRAQYVEDRPAFNGAAGRPFPGFDR